MRVPRVYAQQQLGRVVMAAAAAAGGLIDGAAAKDTN
jgi:hypothetical protein